MLQTNKQCSAACPAAILPPYAMRCCPSLQPQGLLHDWASLPLAAQQGAWGVVAKAAAAGEWGEMEGRLGVALELAGLI